MHVDHREPVWVWRDENGLVTGYALARPDGEAQEPLPSDHPDVADYEHRLAARMAAAMPPASA